jgi:hypothetical protein
LPQAFRSRSTRRSSSTDARAHTGQPGPEVPIDTASFAISPNGVTASLLTKTATGEGEDTLRAIEWIVGTEHDDYLTGNGSVNLMESRGGDDRLDGGSNDDTLYGGIGTDTLIGGTGYDYCLDGESHSSCEFISTTAVAVAEHPWALDVLGDAVRFLPRVLLR